MRRFRRRRHTTLVYHLTHLFKQASIFCVVALVLLLLAACGTSSAQGKKTIGLSLSSLSNTYFVAMDLGMKDEATKLGYNIIDDNADNDAATQVSQVEDLVTQHVSLLIINPVSSDGIVPAVRTANAAHIPVITVDRGAAGGKVATVIESNNVLLGREAMDSIASRLKQRYGQVRGNVVDLQGLLGTSSGDDRETGFAQELHKYPQVKLVASQAANFDQETAYNDMANILEVQPKIDAVFGANDDNALGALKAIQSANRFAPLGHPGHIVIVGIDGSEQALQAIRAGQIDATVTQNPLKMSARAVDLGSAVLQGHQIQQQIYYPFMLVNLSNINSRSAKDYGLWGDEVPK